MTDPTGVEFQYVEFAESDGTVRRVPEIWTIANKINQTVVLNSMYGPSCPTTTTAQPAPETGWQYSSGSVRLWPRDYNSDHLTIRVHVDLDKGGEIKAAQVVNEENNSKVSIHADAESVFADLRSQINTLTECLLKIGNDHPHLKETVNSALRSPNA